MKEFPYSLAPTALRHREVNDVVSQIIGIQAGDTVRRSKRFRRVRQFFYLLGGGKGIIHIITGIQFRFRGADRRVFIGSPAPLDQSLHRNVPPERLDDAGVVRYLLVRFYRLINNNRQENVASPQVHGRAVKRSIPGHFSLRGKGGERWRRAGRYGYQSGKQTTKERVFIHRNG
jgi:hypothetical protein